MPFDNSVMNPPRKDKPHIQLIAGLYRVSSVKKVGGKNAQHRAYLAFSKAHKFADMLNNAPVRVDWNGALMCMTVYFVGERSYYYYDMPYSEAVSLADACNMIFRMCMWANEQITVASWSKSDYVYQTKLTYYKA